MAGRGHGRGRGGRGRERSDAAMAGTPTKLGRGYSRPATHPLSSRGCAQGYDAGTRARSDCALALLVTASAHRETSAKVDNRFFDLMRAAWESCTLYTHSASGAGYAAPSPLSAPSERYNRTRGPAHVCVRVNAMSGEAAAMPAHLHARVPAKMSRRCRRALG